MKLLLVFSAIIAIVVATEDGYCMNDVLSACRPQGGADLLQCTAKYGQIDSVKYDLQAFANKHITHSFQYLLLSSHFGNYEKNRVGFQKMFRSYSDQAWKNGIETIKYLAKRGATMNFDSSKPDDSLIRPKDDSYELYELQSLARALDIQKSLATEAHRIHEIARSDAEVMSHMENTFVHNLRDTIRDLSGHTNDLKNLILNNKQNSLNVFLFDEYLQKVYS